MPRILHTLPDFHFGGVSNLLLNIITASRQTNPEVEHHICYFGNNTDMLSLFLNTGIQIHKIDYRGKEKILKTLREFSFLVKNLRVDIIHSHLTLDRIISGLSYFLHNVPIIITIHTTNVISDNVGFSYKMKLLLEDFLGRITAKHYIAISATVKKVAIKKRMVPENKISVIYNGVKFSEDYERSWLLSNTCKVVAVGRLIPAKGFLDLINLVKLAREQELKIHLTIVGDGPSKLYLQSKIKEFHLEKHISMVGFSSKVQDHILNADVFVTTSKEEGFSISTVEAMALGRPVFAYDLPIFKELSENGKIFLLAEKFNIAELLKNIYKIRFDENLYWKYSRRCLNKVSKDFRISKTAKLYLRVYQTVINHHKSKRLQEYF